MHSPQMQSACELRSQSHDLCPQIAWSAVQNQIQSANSQQRRSACSLKRSLYNTKDSFEMSCFHLKTFDRCSIVSNEMVSFPYKTFDRFFNSEPGVDMISLQDL